MHVWQSKVGLQSTVTNKKNLIKTYLFHLASISSSSFIKCFYCGRKDHITSYDVRGKRPREW